MTIRALTAALLFASQAFVYTATAATAAPPVTVSPSPAPAAPLLEPKALEILKASLDKIGAAQTLSFTATELFESSSLQGHPLASATKFDVALARPDKLRIFTPGDGPDRRFWYDGTTVTAYVPKENLFATTPAPPTIDAMLESVYKLGAMYFPFTDFIVTDPYKDLTSGLKLAYYVGQSTVVGGTTTDEVAYVDDGVFIQTWFGVDDNLPRLVRAVYLDDPAQLRHELAFSDWKINPVLPANTFVSAAPANAKRVPFEPLQPDQAAKK